MIGSEIYYSNAITPYFFMAAAFLQMDERELNYLNSAWQIWIFTTIQNKLLWF